MNDSLIGFEDSSLIQQWMITISFLGLALFCLLRPTCVPFGVLLVVGSTLVDRASV